MLMNNIAETSSNNDESSSMKTDSEFLEGSFSNDGDINEDRDNQEGKEGEASPSSPPKKILNSENAHFLHKSLKKQKKLVITRQERKEQFKIALEWLYNNREQLHTKKNYAIAGIGGVTNKPKHVCSHTLKQKSFMSEPKGKDSGIDRSSRFDE